ncbi:MAG: tripartite tricarboxylate transporter substrate binding protein [Proteobacteria bacterium]|nr:tripartite tricarboxylate transporter substrate binding protein [Pseudomonadota bacterium]
MNTVLRLAFSPLLLAILPALMVLALVAPALVTPALMTPAWADGQWPQKPVRIVVPFPGGGSADALCRIVGEKLSAAWNQPVIVDNRPGAGGNVGAAIVFHAADDGHTLLCSPPGPLAVNQSLYKTLEYDPPKFVPIATLALVPHVIVARRDLPANSVKELIAYARANAGKVTYASEGGGSASYLSTQMFATLAGVELSHVPYKGEGPALVALAAGRVDLFIGSIAAALRFQKSRDVKFLGVATPKRSPIAPAVPDAAEIGLPNLISGTWFALAAPPGTPATIVDKVSAAAMAALKLEDVRTKFLAHSAEPIGRSPAATAAFFKEEEARWSGVIKSANVTLE